MKTQIPIYIKTIKFIEFKFCLRKTSDIKIFFKLTYVLLFKRIK